MKRFQDSVVPAGNCRNRILLVLVLLLVLEIAERSEDEEENEEEIMPLRKDQSSPGGPFMLRL